MATHSSTYRPAGRLGKWLDARLPLARMMHAQFIDFPTPRNTNYLWTTGGLLSFFLGVQIATGIVLAMHFIPSTSTASSTFAATSTTAG
jgi:ubiquinol-cytochrome c reductase cytochrome b/c1 subunit